MLSQIVKEFKESGGTINLAELSRRLGVERSALDGMLETLVRQGKIKEVANEEATCASCGSCQGCGYYRPDGNMMKVYKLAVPNLTVKGVE